MECVNVARGEIARRAFGAWSPVGAQPLGVRVGDVGGDDVAVRRDPGGYLVVVGGRDLEALTRVDVRTGLGAPALSVSRVRRNQAEALLRLAQRPTESGHGRGDEETVGTDALPVRPSAVLGSKPLLHSRGGDRVAA